MEEILTQLGITSGVSGLVCLILVKMINAKTNELEHKNHEIQSLQEQATKHRVEERNLQLKLLENRITGLEDKYNSLEKTICKKIDSLYERINPMIDKINTIMGYVEAKK